MALTKLRVVVERDDEVRSIYEVFKEMPEIEQMEDMIHSVFLGDVIEVEFEPEDDDPAVYPIGTGNC